MSGKELTIEDVKQLGAAAMLVLSEPNRSLMQQVIALDSMDEVERFFLEHAAEFTGKPGDILRESIVDQMDRRETAREEWGPIMNQVFADYEQAGKDLAAVIAELTLTGISRRTPTQLIELMKKKFGRQHDRQVVLWILTWDNIPMQVEPDGLEET